jgi:hypothetical protein
MLQSRRNKTNFCEPVLAIHSSRNGEPLDPDARWFDEFATRWRLCMTDKTTRCTHCYTEFTDAEIEGAQACPVCGTTGTPCDIADDVTIKINWHELRILGIWADNWAHDDKIPGDSKNIVATIIQRLEAQHPDKTPLTLSGEIRKLQEDYPGASLLRGDGEVLVPPKKVQ